MDSNWRALSFTSFVMREIIDNPLEGETASARLKQVGLMSVLYCMKIDNQPLTLAAITAETGLTRGGIYETIAYLLKRGLLDETEVRNTLGRGKARLFSFPERIFERIREFERSSRPAI